MAIPENPSPQAVSVGSHVVLELVYANETEQLELDIVPDAHADFSHGLLGEGTPLARAILGHPAGEQVTYAQGDIRAVTVLSVSAAADLPGAAELAEREEARRKIVEEANRRDAMIFASSYSGKWGDYDPAGIEEWEKKEHPEDDEA